MADCNEIIHFIERFDIPHVLEAARKGVKYVLHETQTNVGLLISTEK